jgi:hypothetical protein
MQSSVCHLRGLDQRQMVAAKEEATEMGGLVALLDCDVIALIFLVEYDVKCIMGKLSSSPS